MSVIATTSVSIRPSPTIASSSRRRGCLAWPWSSLLMPYSWAAGWLLGGHSAVGHDHGAGHERRLIRGQEQGDVGNLARLARAADGLERIDRGVDLGESAEHLGVSVIDRGVDPAW